MQPATEGTTPERLKIWGADEIEAIYGRAQWAPGFTPEDRLEYFSLAPTEKAGMEQVHSIKSRLYYLLQLGYFKARQRFFPINLPS